MGPRGRGTVAVCAPDEDTLTLAWLAADRALAAAGIESGARRRTVLGNESSAVRRGPEPRVPRRRRSASRPTIGGVALRRIGARRHGGARRRAPTRSPPDPRASRSSSPPTRCGPGREPASKRAVARARPPSCLGADGGGTRRDDRHPRHAHPPLPRPLPRRRRDRQPRPVRRPPVPRGDLPAGRARRHRALAAFDVRAWSLPDPDGRLGAVLAKRREGDRDVRRPTSTKRSATPARRPRSSAASPRSTPRDSSRSSGPAGAARPACSSTSRPGSGRRDHRRRARRRPARELRGGVARPRSAATRRRDDPDGRAARERDVRARRRRDARPARRPLRRLRDDQHAAVDPPALHQLRRAEARAGRARPQRARCTRSS